MIRKLVFWSAVGCGFVLLAGSYIAQSPVEAPVVGPPTESVIAPAPGTSVRMLTDDARQTMEWLRQQRWLGELDRFPSRGRVDLRNRSAGPEGDGTGVSRTIRVESPPVVNSTPRFLFSDVTDRSPRPAVPDQQISMQRRIATVEAYRQSLVKDR